MTNIWENFINVMALILKDAEELVTLSYEKQKVLTVPTHEKVAALVDITKREEILVLKINRAEKERQNIIRQIVSAFETKGETTASELTQSISQIKNLAPKEYAGPVAQLGAKFIQVVGELNKNTRLNNQIVSQYLDFLEFNVNILSAASCEQTYSSANPQNPSAPQVKRRMVLNTKA